MGARFKVDFLYTRAVGGGSGGANRNRSTHSARWEMGALREVDRTEPSPAGSTGLHIRDSRRQCDGNERYQRDADLRDVVEEYQLTRRCRSLATAETARPRSHSLQFPVR